MAAAWRAALLQGDADGGMDPAAIRATIARIREVNSRLQALKEAHPLAFARLWEPECREEGCADPRKPTVLLGDDEVTYRGATLRRVKGSLHECPKCGKREHRTDQRAAAQDLLDGDFIEAFLLGGNRTGKTELGAMLAVAFAYGRDHWVVQAWAKLNRLDVSRIQPGPGRCWAVSQIFSTALEFLRPKLEKYLPAGTAYKNWGAEGEATATLPDGGVVVSKAALQAQNAKRGKNPFEGAAIHFGLFDEESPVLLAVQSTMMRLVDHGGLLVHTMTPLVGWTEFLRLKLGWKLDGKPCPEGLLVTQLTGTDNPHINPRELLRRLATLPKSIRDARLRGDITVLEGAVHPEFSRETHVVESFDIPHDWPRWGAMDFGVKHPTVHLWIARAKDGQFHAFREHYRTGLRPKETAEHIWNAEICPVCRPEDEVGGPKWWAWYFRTLEGLHDCEACEGTGRREPAPIQRWADPEDAATRKTLAEDYAIETKRARKDRRASYLALCELLAIDPDTGRPGIVFHDCCVKTIWEVQNLTHDEDRKDPRDQVPVKGDDHAWDALRYFAFNYQLETGASGVLSIDLTGGDGDDDELDTAQEAASRRGRRRDRRMNRGLIRRHD